MNEDKRIYLDHAACAPLDPIISSQLVGEPFYNASSVHREGQRARQVLEQARRTVSDVLGCDSQEVVFQSGGSESCLFCIEQLAGRCDRVWISDMEHPIVADAARLHVSNLQEFSARRVLEHRCLPPGIQVGDGLVLMAINHETGNLFDCPELIKFREGGGFVFRDAVQAAGRVDLQQLCKESDLLSFAGHKMGAPVSGATFISRRFGGDFQLPGVQEKGRRPGTENVMLAKALACAFSSQNIPTSMFSEGQVFLEKELSRMGAVINGSEFARGVGFINFSVRGWRSSDLVIALDVAGLAVSSGPACSAGAEKRSKSVSALYADSPWRAESAVRLSFGKALSLVQAKEIAERLRRVFSRGAT